MPTYTYTAVHDTCPCSDRGLCIAGAYKSTHRDSHQSTLPNTCTPKTSAARSGNTCSLNSSRQLSSKRSLRWPNVHVPSCKSMCVHDCILVAASTVQGNLQGCSTCLCQLLRASRAALGRTCLRTWARACVALPGGVLLAGCILMSRHEQGWASSSPVRSVREHPSLVGRRSLLMRPC